MWALINADDNSIIEIIPKAKAVTINNFLHSKQIFSDLSWSELNKLGIVQVLDNGTKGDSWQTTSKATYTYNSSSNNVTTSYVVEDKDLDECKTTAKEQTKITAYDFIKRFNWLVERLAYDSSKTIPSAVGTYVGDIKTDCAAIETAIDGASDMAAFKALYEDTVDSDGKITEVARINRWTDDTNIKTYIR
tara:strand:- start:28 stop:600 length:573 start_codon:yes stop_codon:yes gene_type:complete